MKVIVSRYKEDLSWVVDIKHPYVIYNKGDFFPSYINVPNEGREGETYLRYILENYDNLPETLVLCQGNPFDHCRDFIHWVNEYTPDQGLVGLSHWVETEIPNEEGYFPQEAKGVVNTLPLLGIGWEVGPLSFYTGAQYIVPKSFIVSKSKEWWEKCYKVYADNPRSPWIFERIWNFIFHFEYVLH
jgi:hypothetical protein